MTIQPPPPPASSAGSDLYASYPPAPATTDRTNVLAIVSLVLGIVSYFTGFFLAIGAIITGHLALRQLKRTGEKGRGFAIAGLILGYLSVLTGIVVAIILIFFVAALGVAGTSLSNALGQVTSTSAAPASPFASSSPSAPPSAAPSAAPGSTDVPGAAQTTAEACTVLQNDIGDSISALNDNAAQLQSDPAAAVTALQSLSADFATAESQINNPDVLSATTQTRSNIDTMVSDIQAYLANPTTGSDAIVADSSKVGASLQALGTLCG